MLDIHTKGVFIQSLSAVNTICVARGTNISRGRHNAIIRLSTVDVDIVNSLVKGAHQRQATDMEKAPVCCLAVVSVCVWVDCGHLLLIAADGCCHCYGYGSWLRLSEPLLLLSLGLLMTSDNNVECLPLINSLQTENKRTFPIAAIAIAADNRSFQRN